MNTYPVPDNNRDLSVNDVMDRIQDERLRYTVRRLIQNDIGEDDLYKSLALSLDMEPNEAMKVFLDILRSVGLSVISTRMTIV